MFSKEEYQNRINKVTAEMSKRGLDALVVIDEEDLIGGGNVGYLTGFFHCFCFPKPPSAVVIAPPDVILCAHPGFFQSSFRAIKFESLPVKDVIGSGQALGEITLGKDIRTALEKTNRLQGKVGVDGIRCVTEPEAQEIRTALKDVNIVENTRVVEKVRLVKSPAEMDVIRQASKTADIGVTAWMHSIKAGDPQSISAITGEQAARLAGAEESVIFMGAGNPWIYGKYRGSQTYQQGDMANTEFMTRLHGYWGQVNRTVIVGKPSDRKKLAWDIAMESYLAMAAALKPGVKACDVYAAGEKIIVKAGMKTGGRLGHGMGLTIAEGFNIDGKDQTEMQPGHYVMLHNVIPLFDEGMCPSIGNAFLITDKGVEDLNKAEFLMQV